jgi:hypothetical protein
MACNQSLMADQTFSAVEGEMPGLLWMTIQTVVTETSAAARCHAMVALDLPMDLFSAVVWCLLNRIDFYLTINCQIWL